MTNTEKDADNSALEDILADADTGGRVPKGSFYKTALLYLPLVLAVYQLWIASPLPFMLGWGVWNDTQTRAIHLGFAVILAFLAFPGLKSSPRTYIPKLTWAIAIVGAIAASYL